MHLPWAIKCAEFLLISIVPALEKAQFLPSNWPPVLLGRHEIPEVRTAEDHCLQVCLQPRNRGMRSYHQESFRGSRISSGSWKWEVFLYLEEGRWFRWGRGWARLRTVTGMAPTGDPNEQGTASESCDNWDCVLILELSRDDEGKKGGSRQETVLFSCKSRTSNWFPFPTYKSLSQ